MANHASALKRHRQNIKRRARNRADRSQLRTERKALLQAIETAEKDAATEQFGKLQKLLDRAADHGLIHKNKAARVKSRLSRKLAELA